MKEKIQNAIGCSAFLLTVYGIYCLGNVIVNHVFPDGLLFGGVFAAVAFVWGYKLGKGGVDVTALPAIAEQSAKKV